MKRILGTAVVLLIALGMARVPAVHAGSPDPAVQAPANAPPTTGFYSPPPPPPQTFTATTTFDPTAQPVFPTDTTVNTTNLFHPPAPYATAQCRDGYFSYSQTTAGTCSGYGGVLNWIYPPGTAPYTTTASTALATSPAVAPVSPSTAPASSGQFIPYAGNGGGPTLCNNGLYSHSSGSGTCSSNGGEAH